MKTAKNAGTTLTLIEKAKMGANAIPNDAYRDCVRAVIAKVESNECPVKFLMIDGRDWVVARAEDGVANVRETFKQFHGRRPSAKAKLWIIPYEVTVCDDLSYTIPQDAQKFAWVEVK